MRYEPGRCLLHHWYNATGISQRDVHIITGISESQLSQYANDYKKMGSATRYTVAKALKLPNSDMLYEWLYFDE
ncbi:HTH cro/C1-type domain-containing protein [Cohnella lubricantis]|nr:transcriptional regulator with XRE-family HTH domain [Cohnella lubricantis]